MTEQFLRPDAIRNVFGDDELNVSYQYYSEQIQALHHVFLRSQLTSDQLEIDIDQLIQFNQDAEFIAKEFTNPLVVEHIEGLPKDEVPSKQQVQDALALAGALFEYLGDIQTAITTGSIKTNADQRLQSAEQYYIKSGLCYALGRYEARTRIMLRRVISTVPKPKGVLTIHNIISYTNYTICSLIARDFVNLKLIQRDNEKEIAAIRETLQHNALQIGNDERISKRELLHLNYALSCLEACFDAAFALMEGETGKIANSDDSFRNAIDSLYQLGNFEQLWVIRTLQKVIHRMWDASPWTLLNNVIPNRNYIKQLVMDGYVTLWHSQVEALAMRSRNKNIFLDGGYLDDAIKRVVVNMPTSAGKTLIAELAIAKVLFEVEKGKCIYVAPYRSLRDQVADKLSNRLARFGFRVTTSAGDNEINNYEDVLFDGANVVVVTPEKLMYMIRQNSSLVQETSLIIFDEIHNIGKDDSRAWLYEQLISLLIQDEVYKSAKMIFISAIMPNHLTIREWVDSEGYSESINTIWQPTRLLKGAIRFPLSRSNQAGEMNVSGDLIYVRHKDDLKSPLEIKNIIQSRQVVIQKVSKRGKKYYQIDEKQSDGSIENSLSAALKFARLGPVLVYTPQKAQAVDFCRLASDANLEFLPPIQPDQAILFEELIEYITDRLPDGHPLIEGLRNRVSYHHGDLPGDVRSEIERAYENRWVYILAATSTVIEGVNFPIKTLIILDYYASRYYDGKQNVKKYSVSPSSFQNMAGRAGRALYETEGQVLFIQPIIPWFPYDVENDFERYFDIDSNSVELEVTSRLANDDLLAELGRLTQEVDNGTLIDENLLFDLDQNVDNDETRSIIESIHTYILLLGRRGLTSDHEEAFVSAFQRTLGSVQQPHRVAKIAGGFGHRSHQATEQILTETERELFSRTGLKLSVSRQLSDLVRQFWDAHLSNDFLQRTEIDDSTLHEIGNIVYSINDTDMSPPDLKQARSGKGKNTNLKLDHINLFVDWVDQNDTSEVLDKHFNKIKDPAWRAEQFLVYVRTCFEYNLPWLLSGVWLFSKNILLQSEVDLLSTPFGREFILLPSYARYGVKTPAAAFFSSIGITPFSLAWDLAQLYYETELYEHKYDYMNMMNWIFRLEPRDLYSFSKIQSRYVRRFIRIRNRLKPVRSDGQVAQPNQWQISFRVAGWKYYSGDKFISDLSRGLSLILKPDQENEVDPNAIAVLTTDGTMLGYVPWDLAEDIGTRLSFSRLDARVFRVNETAPPYERLHVIVTEVT